MTTKATTASHIATIILQQIYAGDSFAMARWGASKIRLALDETAGTLETPGRAGGVAFTVKGTVRFPSREGLVAVELESQDTYRVTVYRKSRNRITLWAAVETRDDVYCDEIAGVIDRMVETAG